MPHFPASSSAYKREWVRDLPQKYEEQWDAEGLVKPPVKSDGSVVRSVPFYAAQQLHRLHRIPRQLRGATKPVVVTTSKIGEPFYTPQLDFDLRTVRPLPLSYNNLLDPHLKHFFNNPAKRRVLEKRGFITSDGDVICHSMKELNQYRDFLYWNHQEMLKSLRDDMNSYMPKILAKRRAIAEITAEQRRYQLLQRSSGDVRQKNKSRSANKSKVSKKSSKTGKSHNKPKPPSKANANKTVVKEEPKVRIKDEAEEGEDETSEEKAEKLTSENDLQTTEEETEAATKIQAAYKGYMTRKSMAKGYKKKTRNAMRKKYDSESREKIWNRGKADSISTCHTHSCTEHLSKQFIITDLPAMMRFLKDPVAQQAYRRNYLLRLMHTPSMDISGTMVKPLLKDEIKHHSSKFRWV